MIVVRNNYYAVFDTNPDNLSAGYILKSRRSNRRMSFFAFPAALREIISRKNTEHQGIDAIFKAVLQLAALILYYF